MTLFKDYFKRMILSSLVVFCAVCNFPAAAGGPGDSWFSDILKFFNRDKQSENSDMNRPIALSSGEDDFDEEFFESLKELDGDFTSKRLLIATDNPDIFREGEPIISEFDGLYLVQYETLEETIESYLYYLDKAEFVEPDVEVAATDDNESVGGNQAVMTEENNPFNELNNSLSSTGQNNDEDNDEIIVALLDSGTIQDPNVVGSFSVLGEDASDDNGHAREMIAYMKSVNPEVLIFPIKVLDSNAKGSISSVIAGIEYAIAHDYEVINLSLSAKATEDNILLREYIKKAQDAGLYVVGSAGNGGHNAKYYVPGKIEEAIVITSLDEDGNITGNYGDSVDYGVIADSTSEATAVFSALLHKVIRRYEDFDSIFENERVQNIAGKDTTNLHNTEPVFEDDYFNGDLTLSAISVNSKINGITVKQLPSKNIIRPTINWSNGTIQGPEVTITGTTNKVKYANVFDVTAGSTTNLSGYKFTYNNAFSIGNRTFKIVVTPLSVYFNKRTHYYYDNDVGYYSVDSYPSKRFISFLTSKEQKTPGIEYNSTFLDSYAGGIAPWKGHCYTPDVTVRMEIFDQKTGEYANIKEFAFIVSDIDANNDGFYYNGELSKIYVGDGYHDKAVNGGYDSGKYYFQANIKDADDEKPFESAILVQGAGTQKGVFDVTTYANNKGWSHIDFNGIVLIGTTAKVVFRDVTNASSPTTLKTLPTFIGTSGEAINYNPSEDIANYTNTGNYVLVNNPFTSTQKYADTERTIYIDLKRTGKANIVYRDVTESTPVQLEATSVSGAIDSTITYDPTSRINYYKNNGYNLVANPFPTTEKFTSSVKTFNIDLKKIPKAHAIVVYKDITDNKELERSSQMTGYINTNIDYSPDSKIASYVAKGYELEKNPFTSAQKYPGTENETKTIVIELSHKRPTVHDDDLIKKTVRRVIHYVYDDGHLPVPAPDRNQSTEFSRVVYLDQVTNTYIYEDWTPENSQLAAVTSPYITGYTPDRSSVPAVTVTAETPDIEETVVYSRNPYTLTVVPNGGSWEEKTDNSSITQLFGTTRDIELPVREDHAFVEWKLDNDPFHGNLGSTTEQTTYTFGAGNDTIVAQWVKVTAKYTVNIYYQEEGVYPDSPDEVYTKKGRVAFLAEATEHELTPKRAGNFLDEDAPNVLSAIIKEDDSTELNIYFKPLYTVEFKPGENAEFEEEIHPDINWGEETPNEPIKVCKPGYQLDKWTPAIEERVTHDAVYYANCVPALTDYAIEFYYQNNGQYGEYETREVRQAYTDSKVVATEDDLVAKKEKYILDDNATGKIYEAIVKPDGSTVLRVYFKPQFTVIYKAGEHGDFEPVITEHIDWGTKTPDAPDTPAKTGYKFSNWDKTIEDVVTHDEVYTALYIPITYKVIYKPNGGKGNMDPQTATYDVKDYFKENKFTRDSCKFVGWNSSENGKGTSVKEKQEFLNLTHEEGKEIILYAIWDCPPVEYASPATGIER